MKPYYFNIKKTSKELPEQASGFSPYTRGYETLISKPCFVSKLPDHCYTLELNKQAVVSLFQGFTSVEAKKDIHLFIELSAKAEDFAYVAVLRTLYAYYLKVKKIDTATTRLIFYINLSEEAPLLSLNIASALGVDYIVCKNEILIRKYESFTSHMPVDPFYGSKTYDKHLNQLFFDLKEALDSQLG